MNIAILITCFNEGNKIFSCLDALYKQIDLMKADTSCSYMVYLADGGSTDGSFGELEERYPQLKLTRGMYGDNWIQGTRLGWELAEKYSPDAYIWLSSKIELAEGALASIVENSSFFRHRAIIAGSVSNSDGKLILGGRKKSLSLIAPDNTIPLPCAMFDGALVFIPKAAFEILGGLHTAPTFSYASYDYGLRAAKMNIPRVVAPGILARTAICFEPCNSARSRERFVFDCRRVGVIRAIGNWMTGTAKRAMSSCGKTNGRRGD